MTTRTTFALVGAAALAAVAWAKEVDTSKLPPPSDQKNVTFEKDIKPIFDKSCVKCHGGEKPKGKLRLDTLEGALKGGVDGKVVEPGNSAKSVLVLNIAHLERMPSDVRGAYESREAEKARDERLRELLTEGS